MEWLLNFLHSAIEFLSPIACSILRWATKVSISDVTVWLIVFSMNTWGATLKRARESLHQATQNAIEKSRLKVQQAQLVEQLQTYLRQNPEDAQKIIQDFDRYFSKLEKWKNQDSQIETCESTACLPEFVLSLCALITAFCIIGGWFYNITLIVLVPFPVIMSYYTGQSYFRVRYIERKRAKLFSKVGSIKCLIEKQEKAQKQFEETNARMQEVLKKLRLFGTVEQTLDTVAPSTPDKESSIEKD